MPGKSGSIIGWILIAEIVQQQKRIEILGLAEAEGALQLHASTLNGGGCLKDLLNGSE
jgi:hypothetical protein